MPAKEKPLEYQALINLKLDLVITMLANHCDELRLTLIEMEIISPEASNEAVKLVAEITSTVKIWPIDFYSVLQVLEDKCIWSRPIIEELRKELKLLKGIRIYNWYYDLYQYLKIFLGFKATTQLDLFYW